MADSKNDDGVIVLWCVQPTQGRGKQRKRETQRKEAEAAERLSEVFKTVHIKTFRNNHPNIGRLW